MHTWLPDAHSEAPAPISALMSGVLLSVGIYAVLRFKTVVDLAAGPGFTRRLLVLFGLASMTVAAAFLWSPTNFKRMLAYSSVEHLGLVCLGLGFGGIWGVAGAALHLGNHALAKSVLFLLSGRIRDAYGTVEIPSVRGLLVTMPVTGRGFVVALLALLGLPPFGLFISELMIFGAGFRQGWGFAASSSPSAACCARCTTWPTGTPRGRPRARRSRGRAPRPWPSRCRSSSSPAPRGHPASPPPPSAWRR